MHQKRCITCCIVAQLEISTENTQMLNFFFRFHEASLTNFPTILSVIWYIYPPTKSVLLSVLGVATKQKRLSG
jgi:hypothetical protein